LTIDQQLSIRELTLADASSYRDIRLEGLRLAPKLSAVPMKKRFRAATRNSPGG